MAKLGEVLIQAREERGLTLEDAERDTRIARRYLEALEAEAFDAIPAPVYARGFLRSYSQYLGLDPQQVLALFPRPEEPAQPPPRRGAAREPNASRRPPERPRPERRREEPPRPRERQPAPPQREPVIGVDIGIPAQTNRIRTDPAAQTRILFVGIVAVVVVILVVGLAFAVSQLGDDDTGGGIPGPDGGTTATVPGGDPEVTATTGGAGATSTPAPSGTVPNVTGDTVEAAEEALRAAGYEVAIFQDSTSSAPAGTVVEQAPAADTQLSAGATVTIVVSDGPE